MADYINNVPAADQYTAVCTIGPDFAAKTAVITVANNPVLMQFAVGKYGDWRWTDEREFFSIPQSFRVGNIIGVKFRNANPGQVARILAVLSGQDDPDFQSGIPFSGVLSASGGITPAPGVINGITGSVSAAGGIVAGTGFTVVHVGTGIYTITPNTPFAAPPVVVATLGDHSTPDIIVAEAITANSFQITIIQVGVAFHDKPFDFIAIATQ